MAKEGSIEVFFESKKPLRVFISDTIKKPTANNCDMVILPDEVPKNFTPFKNKSPKGLIHSLANRAPSFDSRGKVVEQLLFLTVRAD